MNADGEKDRQTHVKGSRKGRGGREEKAVEILEGVLSGSDVAAEDRPDEGNRPQILGDRHRGDGQTERLTR
jgi:hypothetical protein